MTKWVGEIPTIILLGEEGYRMAELARKYNVSRERMRQVIKKYIPDWKARYGRRKLSAPPTQEWIDKWGHKENTDLYREQRFKFGRKKANAVRIGYSWTVTFGELGWPTHCPILGIPLNYFAEAREEGSPSFDRIDNSKGYERDNVQIISWRANRIKNDGTIEEHRKIADFMEKTQH